MLFNGDDIMAVTNTNNPEPTTTAVATIHIPCGADGDLVTDAEERLSRAGSVDDVTVDELHRIDPKLSAIVITIRITLQWTTTMTDAKIRDRLAEVSGLESIVRV
jgi:hypothetical protein